MSTGDTVTKQKHQIQNQEPYSQTYLSLSELSFDKTFCFPLPCSVTGVFSVFSIDINFTVCYDFQMNDNSLYLFTSSVHNYSQQCLVVFDLTVLR